MKTKLSRYQDDLNPLIKLSEQMHNDVHKNKEIIDVPVWRFIQRLGDLRNLCDHNKASEAN